MYLFNFDDADDVLDQFNVPYEKREGVEIVAAQYDLGDYEGSALVVFVKNDILYEVHGSHCSCYGLEDQWEPEEMSLRAFLKYKYPSPDFQRAVVAAAARIAGVAP